MHTNRQRVIDERFEFHFNSAVGNIADPRDAHFHVRFEAANGIGFALFEKIPDGDTSADEHDDNDDRFKWLPFFHDVS